MTVIVPWVPTGNEYKAFSYVAHKFADHNHFKLNIEYTPAFAQQLDADKATGNLPDLVDLPSPGAVEQYEHPKTKDGIRLKPLSIHLTKYDQPWRSLAESASGTVYAVPVKADVKSLIWYKTGALASSSWSALEHISSSGTPWCLGLADQSSSGWPGADWVADILLSKFGKAAYESWLAGTWTSGTVGAAWQSWGALIRYGGAVPHGLGAALETPFGSATAAKGCELAHGALSATFQKLPSPAPAGYSHEQFPSISVSPAPVLVSGDFMGLFTDNPYARMLLDHLASYQAQKMWVSQPGYAFSADNSVKPGDYPAMERGIADLLMPNPGSTLCFSAGDIMAPDLSTAFEQAILDYVNDPNSLNKLLVGLQKTAKGVSSQGGLRVAKNACYNREAKA